MPKRRGEQPGEEEGKLSAQVMKTERATRLPKRSQVSSVTIAEIESFWRRKKMEEEDHLLAALKAAARIRAHNLKKEDYKRFEASVEEILSGKDRLNNSKELGAIIRDCDEDEEMILEVCRWTKSKYAYLNQPALTSMEAETARHRSESFIPNSCSRVLGVF